MNLQALQNKEAWLLEARDKAIQSYTATDAEIQGIKNLIILNREEQAPHYGIDLDTELGKFAYVVSVLTIAGVAFGALNYPYATVTALRSAAIDTIADAIAWKYDLRDTHCEYVKIFGGAYNCTNAIFAMSQGAVSELAAAGIGTGLYALQRGVRWILTTVYQKR